MSDAVFPTLPGLAWSITRAPQWSTTVHSAKSGRQYAVSDRQYPTYRWKLPYEVLRASGSLTELQTLFGFVNARRGRYDDFLYRDQDDQAVTDQSIGTGDGVTTSFPLVRAYGGFVEPVIACDTISVKVNGAAAAYGSGPGQWQVNIGPPNCSGIFFTTAPASGATITWSGTYYWRCRLMSDVPSFEQFMKGLWKASIEFESHAL